MFKKYDPRLVRSYRSYKISDLCRIYRAKKLHPQTIRGWINSGKLEAIRDGNIILIYGAIFKKFLLDSNSQHKRILGFNQLRCGKCKAIDAPKDNIITKLVSGRRGCIIVYGICSCCGHGISRIYKAEAAPEIVRSFIVQHNELQALYNISCSTGNTHLENDAKPASCESSEVVHEAIEDNAACTTDNTNIKQEESYNSTSKTNITPTQLDLF